MTKLLMTILSLTLVACAGEMPAVDGEDYTEAFAHQKQTVCTAANALGLVNVQSCIMMDDVRVLLVPNVTEVCGETEESGACYRADLDVIYVKHSTSNPAQVQHGYVHALLDRLNLSAEGEFSGHSQTFLFMINTLDPMVHDHK